MHSEISTDVGELSELSREWSGGHVELEECNTCVCQPRVCRLVDRVTQYFMYSASQSEPRPAVPLGESANEYIELKPVQVCVFLFFSSS